ncbi:MAG: ABC transporter ATP-binding protein [Bacillota bacterium]
MIQVKELSKRFKNIEAVKAISFDVKSSEIFGLLGENGAGKTTTLRMLATVLRPTSGTANIGGHDLLQEPAKVRSMIGVLTGEEGVYQRLTARENVAYFARLNNMPTREMEKRISELFELLEMGEYADRKVGGFSKGMKQKVAIARCLVHDPPVLLMDEPTAGLDVTASRVVRDLLSHCRQQGKTIIFSSHIMSEVEKLCDRVAVIHQGQIVAAGTVAELTARSGQDDFEDYFAGLVGGRA